MPWPPTVNAESGEGGNHGTRLRVAFDRRQSAIIVGFEVLRPGETTTKRGKETRT
jgi:hypothetical protein